MLPTSLDRVFFCKPVDFTEKNCSGCRVLSAVLSRYSERFTVSLFLSWLIDVTYGLYASFGVHLALTHPSLCFSDSLIHGRFFSALCRSWQHDRVTCY